MPVGATSTDSKQTALPSGRKHLVRTCPAGRGSLPSDRMTGQRSYENAEFGQQLYAVLESIKAPETLWAKLATGNYDWLGVRRSGRYVIGRPRLCPLRPDDGSPSPDDAQQPNRIEFSGPMDRKPRWEMYATADEARDTYDRLVTGDPITPIRSSGVWKVRLILEGALVDELLVVRALPRMV